jgi:ATP-dependent Clp protease ATP-binding subunit ClpB
MIRFDKLTLKGQEALQAAQSHAQDKGNPQVAPEHLLWALVEQKDGVVLPILQKLGINLQTIARDLADAVSKLPKVQGQAELYLSPALGRILEEALKEADQFKDEYISTEHLLIALSNAKGEPVSRLLESHGVTKDAILKVLVSIRGTQKITDPNPEEKYQALQRYSRDLTELARKGKLDPVIGRDEEIRRVIQILSRRTKNNPVLIGEPGVGKTAIVEGLAQLERNRRSRRPDCPVHRRAAHAGRRRRRGRRHRRIQHAQAGTGARRPALHRRHYSERISKIHREGQSAGTPLPENLCRRADG